MRVRMQNVGGAMLLGLLISSSPVVAQDIVFTSGGADIFFLYESAENVWHTVFRAKGPTGGTSTTGATGLTTPFAPFVGAVGTLVAAEAGDTGDYVFDSLTVNLSVTETQSIGATDFFFSNANGHFTNSVPAPDLGMRIRLIENQVAMGTGSNVASNQFENFTFTLNTALSTFNSVSLADTSAHVSFFANDNDNAVALFNSASGDLTGTFDSVSLHTHRNWGFSEYGEYVVVLDVQGVGGAYGDRGTQASINFNVIPEPSTFALVVIGLGFGGLIRKKRLQSMG